MFQLVNERWEGRKEIRCFITIWCLPNSEFQLFLNVRTTEKVDYTAGWGIFFTLCYVCFQVQHSAEASLRIKMSLIQQFGFGEYLKKKKVKVRLGMAEPPMCSRHKVTAGFLNWFPEPRFLYFLLIFMHEWGGWFFLLLFERLEDNYDNLTLTCPMTCS